MGEFSYPEACGYIEKIPKFTKKNLPGNTEELLRRLNHPEDSFSTIHVAGTNGKGSVCAYLESILREEGYRTGLFISPHLVDIRERFQIGRKMIREETFAWAFRKVKECADGMMKDGYSHPAYFEFLFAMGMLIFRDAKIDVLVMETGLGGRLDATNCVRHPSLCVITSISFDHTEYLGDTIKKIASEKAGIIKKGVPVVADGFPRENIDVGDAMDVIREKAEEEDAPLTVVTEYTASCGDISGISGDPQEDIRNTAGDLPEITYAEDGIEFPVNNQYYKDAVVHLPFMADYQVENCLTAMMAAAVFGKTAGRFSQEKVLAGICRTRWPGRMEMVLPGVVVDGAHNDDGIAQFLKTVRRIAKKKPVSLLFSAVSDKDYDGMARRLCQAVDFEFIVTTEIEGPRKIPADILAGVFRKYTDVPVTSCGNIRKAFRAALMQKKDSVLFCAGSLYLAGEIKAEMEDRTVQKH